jgi:hypothetical protein
VVYLHFQTKFKGAVWLLSCILDVPGSEQIEGGECLLSFSAEPSVFLFGIQKYIKIYRITVLPVVLRGCETSLSALR